MALANAKSLAEAAKLKAEQTMSTTFVDLNELTISINGKMKFFKTQMEKDAYLMEMEKS